MTSADLGALSPWAPEIAQTFVSLASDIALVLDDSGVIRNVAQGGTAPLAPAAHEWVGRPWAETVTSETRGKIEQLLQEVTSTGLARRREINHPGDRGGNVAVAYTAIRLGSNGPLLAVGRDLGAITAIQQRYLEAQQELERGYWRARQAEARYRLLFQVATDAVLLVDADNMQVLDANQAASQLFDLPVQQIVGRQASFGFERHSRQAIDELLLNARSSGNPAEIRARLLGKINATSVAATPFQAEGAMRMLVRVRGLDMPGSSVELNATLARLVDSASDGVVVTDSSGRILMANPAFLKLSRVGTEIDVKGRPIMDWVGVSDEQFASLLSQVRGQGIAHRLATRLLASDAHVTQVEVSAALLTEGDQECIGFTIRGLPASQADSAGTLDDLSRAIAKLNSQVGQAPLPQLLREAAVLLERHFIRVAMERSDDNPEAAAVLLGVDPGRIEPPKPQAGPSPARR
jgi:transcriptional regulator PpsR